MSIPELAVKLALVLGKSLLLVIAGYALISMLATLLWRLRRRQAATGSQPVSILKPLHGDEPDLYENLRSFCVQDYPEYQIVFGAHSEQDPALRVVERLRREFPQRDIICVVNPAQHGSNHKISNLINIEKKTRHDWLVLADSDIRVGPDYLQRVTAPLARARTGIVTCLYRGRPSGGIWSRLGALFINEWFVPTVLVARLFGSSSFGFGATIALRRDSLLAIGGFKAFANQLADDYQLGELTRARGLQTVLSDYVVETSVIETSATGLMRHELRWLRTIRAIQPGGYLLMFITFGLPMMLLLALVPTLRPMALPLLAFTAGARAVIHYDASCQRPSPGLFALLTLPLLPLRDLLSLGVWATSFASRRVSWAGNEFSVADDGSLHDVAQDFRSLPDPFRDVEHDHSKHV